MPSDLDTPTPSRLQMECLRLGGFTLVATPVLSMLIVLDRTGALLAAMVSGRHAVDGRDWGLAVVALVPAVIYLLSLWQIGTALRAIGREGRFVTAVAATLRGVGLALALGALFQIALAPALDRALGHGPGYWIGLDSAAITLGALGLVLIVFARLFRRAARLENTLGEFI